MYFFKSFFFSISESKRFLKHFFILFYFGGQRLNLQNYRTFNRMKMQITFFKEEGITHLQAHQVHRPAGTQGVPPAGSSGAGHTPAERALQAGRIPAVPSGAGHTPAGPASQAAPSAPGRAATCRPRYL